MLNIIELIVFLIKCLFSGFLFEVNFVIVVWEVLMVLEVLGEW